MQAAQAGLINNLLHQTCRFCLFKKVTHIGEVAGVARRFVAERKHFPPYSRIVFRWRLAKNFFMDGDKRSAQVERFEVVDTGRRRRWSEDEKLKIILKSLSLVRCGLLRE